MKKGFAILLIMACVLGLSACGEVERTENDYMTKDAAIQSAESLVDQLSQVYDQNSGDLTSFYKQCIQQNSDEANVVSAAIQSWDDAKTDLGNYVSVVNGEVNGKTYQTTAKVTDDEVIVNVYIQGDKLYKGNKTRVAKEEIIFTGTTLSSMSTTVEYDMSEMMTKAALNTLLGMGTVFAILIIIVICLSIMSAILKAVTGKPKTKKEQVSETAASNTINNIVAQEENQTDDTELVAVITAAIAASEGTSGDDFVVRSIIRRW